MKRILTAALVAALALALAACTGPSDDLAADYQAGGSESFRSGDGRVVQIPAAERGESIRFTGTAVDGSTVSDTDFAGDVLVLNFWYAGCGPCRIEAPLLEEAYGQVAPDGAHFLGVNIYDGPEQATSFEENYGITYPSLLASGDVDLKLAFASYVPLQAVPITLVLDREQRVAARIVGAVESSSILKSLVRDAMAEEW